MSLNFLSRSALFTALTLFAAPLMAQTQAVNAGNFIRAESDVYMASIAAENGGLGILVHDREFVALDAQTIIRMNRDTLYSKAVFDLAAGPVTITMPATDDGRYVAMEVISQDHFAPLILREGTHTVTQEDVGTRYAAFFVRTFVDPGDPDDIAAAHAVQDAISMVQDGNGTLELPDWDKTSHDATRSALLALGALGTDNLGVSMGASAADVDPLAHLIATAVGWGLNPPTEAIYLNPPLTTNDGTTVHTLTMKDIPVDAFWSISVYNKDGFFELNDLNVNSVNSVTGVAGPDGAVTVQFGGCSADGPDNCIPITEGWNYIVRLYRPHPEVQNGSWQLPAATPVE